MRIFQFVAMLALSAIAFASPVAAAPLGFHDTEYIEAGVFVLEVINESESPAVSVPRVRAEYPRAAGSHDNYFLLADFAAPLRLDDPGWRSNTIA